MLRDFRAKLVFIAFEGYPNSRDTMSADRDQLRQQRQNADRSKWGHIGPRDEVINSDILAEDKDVCFHKHGCVPSARSRGTGDRKFLFVTGPPAKLEDAYQMALEIIKKMQTVSLYQSACPKVVKIIKPKQHMSMNPKNPC